MVSGFSSGRLAAKLTVEEIRCSAGHPGTRPRRPTSNGPYAILARELSERQPGPQALINRNGDDVRHCPDTQPAAVQAEKPPRRPVAVFSCRSPRRKPHKSCPPNRWRREHGTSHHCVLSSRCLTTTLTARREGPDLPRTSPHVESPTHPRRGAPPIS
jgi:hypothetical protein